MESLPDSLKSTLPSIEEIEERLRQEEGSDDELNGQIIPPSELNNDSPVSML